MRREVVFGPKAAADLVELHDYIAGQGSPATATAYIERLEQYCRAFDLFSERGTRRDDIRPNLRLAHFERRLLIVFTVEVRRVVILRLLYDGRDVAEAMDD